MHTTVSRTRFRAATLRLAPGTPVLTLDGELPVEHVLPGDRVIARSGAVAVLGVAPSVTAEGLRLVSLTLARAAAVYAGGRQVASTAA